MEDVYGWSCDRFWNRDHQKAAKLNVQLPRKFTGVGIIPQHALCDAAYAASWMQPVQTIAEAGNTGAQAIQSEWNENKSSPSINELRSGVRTFSGDHSRPHPPKNPRTHFRHSGSRSPPCNSMLKTKNCVFMHQSS